MEGAFIMSKNYLLEQASGLIKERYPQVDKIVFKFHYHDSDGLAEDSEETFNRNPESYAYFEFECPYRECIDGGFDLSKEVTEMLKSKKEEIDGEKICMGWQDRERVNKHRCWCELTFEIKATYK